MLCKTFTKLPCMGQLTETTRILLFKADIRMATMSHKLSLATEIWNRKLEKII